MSPSGSDQGGTGHSWLIVELTSEHVPLAGEGGVGQSWFTVELTSDDVVVGTVGTIVVSGTAEESAVYDDSTTSIIVVRGTGSQPPPITERPYVPIPGPGGKRARRRQRFEQRFPGRYQVIETGVVRFRGRVLVTAPQRFPGRYEVVETTVTHFSAGYEVSTLRARRREEEEFMLIFED